MTRLYDISMKVTPGMVHWPDSTVPELEWEKRIAAGDPYDLSRWVLGAHNGTHVDAPSHFIAGAASMADIELSRLVGPARVVSIGAAVAAIDRNVVEGLSLQGVERVLFKTGNSGGRSELSKFDPTYVAFTEDGASAVVETGAIAVGIDYLSVERYEHQQPVAHLAFLRAEVAVIEGLDLRGVPAGNYTLYCLPLRLIGGEAAPARAILVGANSL